MPPAELSVIDLQCLMSERTFGVPEAEKLGRRIAWR
eukprot:CAMPEP_0203891050 /NCGR_PEP_ID=MMETSP0359-20131031/34391_1 /ASSEMBLY_ACC=CAM_ASM_000338 /TAXON_ID=268821 /ORGANISM="Scrippsiella Hangoei, Strain SHTV-5" /LENGTH=35 /DNA_ID= /DNA_START= /DNA_END= /DNA_ORIENTATION=